MDEISTVIYIGEKCWAMIYEEHFLIFQSSCAIENDLSATSDSILKRTW